MTVDVSPVFLLNAERGQPEIAELWSAITEKQLSDWEAEWVPELFKALQRLNVPVSSVGFGRKVATGIGGGKQKLCKECWPIQASAWFAAA